MKADIENLIGEHIKLFIVKTEQTDDQGQTIWEAVIYNHSDQKLENILVNTKGSGTIGDRQVVTATMRYFKDELPSEASFKVESITNEVLCINNEFWISYSLDGKLYEKRIQFIGNGRASSWVSAINAEGFEVE